MTEFERNALGTIAMSITKISPESNQITKRTGFKCDDRINISIECKRAAITNS